MALPSPVWWHRHPKGGAHLGLAEKGQERLVWGGRPTCRSTMPQAQWCTTMVTATGAVVPPPFLSRDLVLGGLGWVVTTTPMVVPPPPCPMPQQLVSSHWFLTVGQATAMSGARHRPVR